MDDTSLAARLNHLLSAKGGHGVVAAYLFGSHAEGRAHRESDVDVGVLLDYAELPTARARLKPGCGSTRSLPRRYDLLVALSTSSC